MRLEIGDIVHAHNDQGTSLICLVLKIEQGVIYSRRITSQQEYSFDRLTGVSKPSRDHTGGTIDSVEPLPVDMHYALIGLDRKYRLGIYSDDKAKLTDDEIRTFLFVGDHYKMNSI